MTIQSPQSQIFTSLMKRRVKITQSRKSRFPQAKKRMDPSNQKTTEILHIKMIKLLISSRTSSPFVPHSSCQISPSRNKSQMRLLPLRKYLTPRTVNMQKEMLLLQGNMVVGKPAGQMLFQPPQETGQVSRQTTIQVYGTMWVSESPASTLMRTMIPRRRRL